VRHLYRSVVENLRLYRHLPWQKTGADNLGGGHVLASASALERLHRGQSSHSIAIHAPAVNAYSQNVGGGLSPRRDRPSAPASSSDVASRPCHRLRSSEVDPPIPALTDVVVRRALRRTDAHADGVQTLVGEAQLDKSPSDRLGALERQALVVFE
jgi:hypothetical protein